MAGGRIWTIEEDEYLREKVGVLKYPTIAKNLKRTPGAVACRALKLGIDNTKIESGKLTVNQLAKECNIDSHTVYRWISNHNLKAIRKISRNSAKFYFIDINDFWKWAKQNTDKINFIKAEFYALLPEPNWVESERKKQYKATPKRQAVKWSEEEDKRLISYVKGNYPINEIATFLNRSDKAIQRRISRLREWGIIPMKKVILTWSDAEINLMLELEEKGLNDSEIAYELGREREHIVDKRRRLKGYKKKKAGENG